LTGTLFNRTAGHTLLLDLTNAGTGVFTASNLVTAENLDGWAVVYDGTTYKFAANSSSGVFSASAETTSTALPTSGATNATSYTVSANTTLTTNSAGRSLTISGAGSTLDLGTRTLTLGSTTAAPALTTTAGILVTGSGANVIENGTLAGIGTNYEINLHNFGTGGLTVSSAISTGTSPFALAGTGNTTLAGAINGTGLFTLGGSGTTTLASGFSLANNNALTLAGLATLDLGGQSISTTGIVTHTSTAASGITNSGSAATLTMGNNSQAGVNSTFSGNLSLVLNAAASTSHFSSSFTNTGNLTLNANGAGLVFLGGNGTTTAGSIGFGTINNTGTITNSGTSTGGVFIGSNLGGNVTAVNQASTTSALTLSGANTAYRGTTTLAAGTQLNLASATALGGNGSTTGTGGALVFGGNNTLNNTSGASLTLTTANALALNGDLTFTGTNNLTFGTGAVTLGNGTRSLNVAANTLTFAGAIGDGGNTFGLTKTGAGILTLAGLNTYTGATTVNGGTLTYAPTAGGSQSFGALTLTGSESRLQSTFAGSGSFLTFSSLSARSAGDTRLFIASGGTNGTTNKITLTAQGTGLIDPGTFFGTSTGSDFAFYDATTGAVRAINYGVDSGTTTAAGGASLTGTHVQTTAAVTAQTTSTFTTLRLSGNTNLTLAGGQTLTTNGVLKAGNVAGGGTLSGGTGLQAANNAELVVRTDGTNDALTISTPILANGSNALTKSGNGTLTLSGANTYTGATTVNAGTLSVGAGGATGTLGNTSGVVLAGGSLTFNRTAALTTSANITGTTGVSGTVTQSLGGGALTLGTLNGANLTLTNSTTTGSTGAVTLNQSGSGLALLAVGGASGSQVVFGGDGTGITTIANVLGGTGQTVKFTAGTVNLSTGRNTLANLDVAGGTLNVVADRLGIDGNATLTIGSGTLNIANTGFGLRFNGDNGTGFAGTAGATATINQSGGTFAISGGTNNSLSMGSTSGTAVTTYNLSGGTLSIAAASFGVRLGADTAGTSTTTFNLSGGKLLSGSSISGSQSTGAKQAFVWTGGTLATSAYDATNLTSTFGTAVGVGTNTLTNAGGTLAPGDIGTAGKTTVTGNYTQTAAGTLAVDIGGTTQGSAFQTGQYDFVSVSGNTALDGRLNFNLINGHTPANDTTTLYTVLTGVTPASSAVTGGFANAVTASGGNTRVIGADGLSSFLVAINNTAATATTGGLTNVAARSVALGGYQATNTYSGAGTDWDTASAAAWTAFDPGATVTPASGASGAIALFADGTASTGAISVSLNSTRNLQSLQFTSAAGARAYTIAQGGSGALILDNTANVAAATLSDTSTSGTANAVNVPITLASNLTATVTDAANTLTLAGAIGEASAGKTLTKAGLGTLVLSGTNTYTGATTVSAGTLETGVAGGLGTGSGTTTIDAGANLNLTGAPGTGASLTYTGLTTVAGAGTINVTLGTGSGVAIFNGNFSGFTGTLNLGIGAAAGAGKVRMNGADNAGMTINALSNGTFFTSSGTHLAALVLNGGDTGESLGQLRLDSSANWAGNVVLAGTITGSNDGFVGSTNTGTISGVIGETGGPRILSKVGGGTILLTNANTYTGATTVLNGTLSVASLNSVATYAGLGTTHAASSNLGAPVTVADGTIGLGRTTTAGTLVYTGSGETTDRVLNLDGTTGGGTVDQSGTGLLKFTSSLTATGVGAKLLSLQGSTAGSGELAGAIVDSSSGATSLTKAGSGTWTLSGANIFTGATSVSAGVLNIQNATALGTTAAGTSVTSGAALQVQNNITVGAEALTLSGSGISSDGALRNISGNNTFGGLLTLGAATRINSDAGTLTLSNTGTITGAGFDLTVGGVGNTTIAGILGTTTGTLTKDGAGTLTLSGANTYTGLTTVSTGSLAIGSSGSLFSGNALTVGASSTADFANAGQTLGAVSNANIASNALNFSATSGTVTLGSLSGAGNTRFGSDAVITGGIAEGTVNAVGNLTANLSGGTTTVGGVATIGTLSSGTANLNGATSAVTTLTGGTVNLGGSTALTVNAGTYAGGMAGGGSLTKAGATTLTLTGANSYTGNTTVSTGVLNIQHASALGTTAAGTTVASGAALQLQNNITVGAEALTLSGSGVASGGALNNLSGTNTFGGLITLGAATRINADTGTLTLSNTGTITGAGFELTLGGAGDIVVDSIIGTGAGNLIKDGAGTVTLNAANTFTGTTTIQAGTLKLGAANALGSTSSIFINDVAGALLDLNGFDVALGSLAGGGTSGGGVSLGSTTLTVGGDNSSTSFASNLTGSGGLTKVGTGTFTLTQANAYTGLTTVSAGELDLNTTGAPSIAGNLRVNGGIAKLLQSDQLASGKTLVVNSGTFDLQSFDQTLAGVQLTGGTLAGTTGTLTSTSAFDLQAGTVSAGLAGAVGLNKTTTGTLTLSGSNSYTGTTTVAAGTLSFNAAAALGATSAVNLADTTTLIYTGAATTVDRNLAVTAGTGTLRNTGGDTLTLAGTLTKNGTILTFAEGDFDVTGTIAGASANSDLVVDGATVTLSHANTYNGPTFLRNGASLTAAVTGALPAGTRTDLFLDSTGTGSSTLTLGADQVVASLTGATSSTVDLGANALTVGTTSGSTTFAGTITGSGGALVKDGASTLSLTGTNSYSGGTTLTGGGTLVFTTGGLGTTGTVNFSGNSTLRFGAATTTDLSDRLAIANGVTATLDDNGNDLVFAATFGAAGSGAMTKVGSGTLTLTAAATYTGVTTVSAGALHLGDGTASNGSVAGDLVNNAVLVFANPTAQTYAGAISGTGSFTKLGAGSLALSGTHSYTGATAINQGSVTLSAGALGGTAVIVGTGLTPTTTTGHATLAVAGDYTLGTTSAGSLTISGGNTSGAPVGQGTLSLVDAALNTLTLARTTGGATNLTLGGTAGNAAKLSFELGDSGSDKIVVNQNLLLNAGGAQLTVSQLTGTQLTDGTYDLLTFANTSTLTGAFTFAGGVTTMAAGGGRTFTLLTTTTAERLQVQTVLNASNAYWSGAVDSSWSTLTGGNATNWVNAPTGGTDPHQIPGADTNVYLTADSAIHFAPTTLDGDFTINSLNFTGTGTSATSAVTIASGASAHTLTLQATSVHGNVAGSGLTVESGAGAHTIAANVALGADQTWGNFSANTLTVSGVISGVHALTLNGDFTFAGSAANTHSGLTTLAAGTFRLNKTPGFNALGGDLDVDGGTVQWLASHQLSNTSVLEIDGGTVNLGAFDETVGTVNFLFGTISGTSGVLSATTFDVQSGTIAAILGGSGSLNKTTTGTGIINTASTFTGGTTVSAGTLELGVVNALAATGAVNVAGGVLDVANHNQAVGALTLTNGAITGTTGVLTATAFDLQSGTVSAILGGSGSTLSKTTAGTVTLTGVNTYTGVITVSAGTLTLNAAGGAAAHTSAVAIATGGTLALGAANQINQTANLSLNGGTLDLNGFNQTLGTLALTANSTIDLSGSASLAFADSSALDWSTFTLSFVNFSATTNSLRFGTTAGGLTATQLSLIRFSDFGNIAGEIDANGFLAPISGNYLNAAGTDIVISAPVTGTTTVTQSGTASTTLTAPASTPNTSTGLASVTDGVLVIGTAAGGNWAGNVTVSGTGTLKGRGDIAGLVTVNSGGNYSPGNSPAIQHVGALTVNTGGLVTIELDGATAGNGAGFHDQIISAGAVNLGNGITPAGTLSAATIFAGSSSYVPALGTSHTVITGSAVTGTFADYDFAAGNNAAGVTWMPEYTATAVKLFVVPQNYATLAGLTPNQTQIGAALQSLRPTQIDHRASLTDAGTLFNGLMRQDAGRLGSAYTELSPEKFTALSAASFQSASFFNSSLQQRSAELRRQGPASVSLNGVATPAPADEFTMETVIEDGVRYQIAKAKPRRPWGYFAGASGALADIETGSDRLGYQAKTGSAYCGLDYALNANHTLGLVISQAFAEAEFAGDGGSVQTNTQRFGVFHDFHQGGFYLNSAASVGYSNYDTQRKVGFLGQTAQGETRGLSYGGQFSTGYDFKVGPYVFGPTAALAYDHAQIDAFAETGSAADLNVGRQQADSLTSHLGVHVSRPFVWRRVGWIPDLSLGVTRQHFNPNAISARFAAGGSAFRVQPQVGGGEFVTPGASLTALLGNGWSVRVGYDAILNQDSSEHRVNLSVNAGF
jgi:autotransporter-associated beta strand protein